MSENAEGLILEHLRAIHARLDKLAEEMVDLKQRMSSLENAMNSLRRENSAVVDEGAVRQQQAG